MDKDMRQKCILCEQLKPYVWHQSATTFICADCRADAKLGRAVRRMPVDAYLLRVAGGWQADAGIVPDIAEGDTPEAALAAAGLMEVKK